MKIAVNTEDFCPDTRKLLNKVLKNHSHLEDIIRSKFNNRTESEDWVSVKGMDIHFDDGDETVCIYPIKKVKGQWETDTNVWVEVLIPYDEYVPFIT